MRLDVISNGQKWINRARFAWRRIRSGRQVTDIHKALFYRDEFFGQTFGAYWKEVQYKGPSTLTVGERQMLAAVVSQANRCRFCTVGHAEAATRYLSRATVDAILSDLQSPPVRENVAALARFSKKLALHPAEISSEDVAKLVQQGIPKEDIEMAIHLCAAYCVINRVADALDFEVPPIYDIEVDPVTNEIRVGAAGQSTRR